MTSFCVDDVGTPEEDTLNVEIQRILLVLEHMLSVDRTHVLMVSEYVHCISCIKFHDSWIFPLSFANATFCVTDTCSRVHDWNVHTLTSR